MPTSLRQILTCAADLIAAGKWTQGAEARNEWGRPLVSAHSPDAARFCAIGAIRRCAGNVSIGGAIDLAHLHLPRYWRHRSLVSFNDSGRRTAAQVAAVLRKAAAAASDTPLKTA